MFGCNQSSTSLQPLINLLVAKITTYVSFFLEANHVTNGKCEDFHSRYCSRGTTVDLTIIIVKTMGATLLALSDTMSNMNNI